jgi:tetratricopeptide (TPR) repeat protein
VEFSAFRSWAEVSAVMAPGFTKAATLSAASPLKVEAARIRAATSDPLARAMLALKLVQDQVRYVYVGLNDGAYVPADADETWTRRFGDCKAKTVLLIALLKELDVEAEPALVNTAAGDAVNESLPMLEVFDHVIVRASIGGQAYWLDGTRIGDRDAGELMSAPYHWALPVRADGGALTPLAPRPARLPTAETVLTIDASAGLEKPTPVTAEVVYRGDEAIQLQRSLVALPVADAERGLKQKWTDDISWVEPAKVGWSYDEKQNLVTLTMQGSGKAEWSDAQSNGSPTAVYFEMDNSAFDAPAARKRPAEEDQLAPWAIDFPSFERWTTVMKLPKGGKVFGVRGVDIHATLGGYAYERRTRQADDTVIVYRSLRALQPQISVAEAAEVEASRKDFSTGAVYVSADDKPERVATAKLAERAADGDPVNLLQLAYGQALTKDYDAALTSIDAALAKDATLSTGWVMKASILATQAKHAEAAEAFGEAIKHGAIQAEMYQGEAYELTRLGQRDQALALLTSALVRYPKDGGLLARRAEVYLAKGDIPHALADCDAALALDPKAASVHRVHAQVLAKAERFEEALASVSEVARLEPDSPDNFDNRGRVLAKLDRHEEAAADFEEALRIDPLDHDALSGLAEAERRLGRSAVAFRRIDAALDLTPSSATLLNSSCWARAVAGQELDRAAVDCDAALKLEPKLASVLDSRGFVSLRKGQFKQAIGFYDAALAARPDVANSLFGRGLAKIKIGDAVAGNSDLVAARALSPKIDAEFAAWGVKP